MWFGIILLIVLLILFIMAIHWVQVTSYDSEKLRKAMEESDRERIVRIIEVKQTMFERFL